MDAIINPKTGEIRISKASAEELAEYTRLAGPIQRAKTTTNKGKEKRKVRVPLVQKNGDTHLYYTDGTMEVVKAEKPKQSEALVDQAKELVRALVPPKTGDPVELSTWINKLIDQGLFGERQLEDDWRADLARVLYAWLGETVTRRQYGVICSYAKFDKFGRMTADGHGAAWAAQNPAKSPQALALYQVFQAAGVLHETIDLEVLLAA